MTPDAAPSPMSALRTAGRVLIVALVLAGGTYVLSHRAAVSPMQIKAEIAGAPLAPIIYLLAHILASLVFVPRTFLAVAAGLLFGTVGGFLWASIGSTLGAVAGFVLARYVNSGLIEPESMPKLGPLLVKAETGGWRAVAALRLIPVIPQPVTNYGLGLTRLSLGNYTLGTLIGSVPMTVAYVEFGAAGEEVLSGGAHWLLPTLIGAAVVAASTIAPMLIARRR
ncbi:MAG TPA: VTT domain-containing protein [Stellaceae bacterium]|nr:VTT domain-containing protein [Stellaceae bacterium]